MRMQWLWVSIVSLVFAHGAHAAVVYDAALEWHTLSTAHFQVHYHEGEEALAQRAAALAEQVASRLTAVFAWTPQAPVDVVLNDRVDLANGNATPVPRNRVILYVTPPRDGLGEEGDWLERVITHELTHIWHLDKASGGPLNLRQFLGRFFLLMPNIFEPAWLTEGLATYYETDATRGVGRGQSSYFAMLMRMEVEGGFKPVTQVNQAPSTWPGGTVAYLYGVAFYQYLVRHYGAETVQRLVANYSTNLIPFRINTNTSQILGKDVEQLWAEFAADTQARYQPRLTELRAAGLHAGTQVTHEGYSTGAGLALPDGTMYYIRANGKSHTMLMRRASGSERDVAVTSLHGGAYFDVHPQAGVIVAQPEYTRNANLFYDLYRLPSGASTLQRLTVAGRYTFVAWHPDGTRVLAVQRHGEREHLVGLNIQGQPQETLWEGAPGERMAGLNLAPDGQTVVSVLWRPGSGWNVEEFSLTTRAWHALTQDTATKLHPRYTPDGQAIVYSADYAGVYNLQRLERASGRITSLTRVLGGAFRPSLSANGDVYYTGYSAAGYDVYRVPATDVLSQTVAPPPGVSDVAAPAPPPVNGSVHAYSPWPTLAPTWWFPLASFLPQQTALGALTYGADVLNRHNYSAALLYDVQQQEALWNLGYLYDRWQPGLWLTSQRQLVYDYDDSGKTLRRIRRSDSTSAGATWSWREVESVWSTTLGVAHAADTGRALIKGLGVPSLHDNLLGIAAGFDSGHVYPLSVSVSDGRHVVGVVESSEVMSSDFAGQVYRLDWREYFALGGEHVLSLRANLGWGTDRPRQFRLGGVQALDETLSNVEGAPLTSSSPFNRRDFALRGYARGSAGLTGRRMALTSAEWRFPLRRVERGIMSPPIGLDQWLGALFVDSGTTWDDHIDHYFTGAGMELAADMRLGYAVPLRLTLGLARGVNAGGETQLYMRLGATF